MITQNYFTGCARVSSDWRGGIVDGNPCRNICSARVRLAEAFPSYRGYWSEHGWLRGSRGACFSAIRK
jgi:hypothetical protein